MNNMVTQNMVIIQNVRCQNIFKCASALISVNVFEDILS